MAHALLSPSKSSTWLNCTPSAKLCEKYPNVSNEAADEGTLAHKLCELLLKQLLQSISKANFAKEFAMIKKHKWYNAAMYEHCEQFATFVMEIYNGCLEKYDVADIFLEVKIDLQKYIPEGFGTADVVIIAGNGAEVFVIDFKYGKGVFVKVHDNTQMRIYALGVLDCFSIIMTEPLKKLSITIYQPRLNNISVQELHAKLLQIWGDTVLRPKAKLAYTGKGELNAGEHCTFCPAKVTCTANAKFNLSTIGNDFGKLEIAATKLSSAELISVYLKAKQIRNWLSGIEEYMLAQAKLGKKWKGLKLVNGRSTRVIANPEKLLQILKNNKIPTRQYLSEPQLLGITALEQNIGADKLAKLAGKLIAKPPGKLSLVKDDSPAKEFNVNESAANDFI